MLQRFLGTPLPTPESGCWGVIREHQARDFQVMSAVCVTHWRLCSDSFTSCRDDRFWTSPLNSEMLCTYFLQAQDRAPVVSCFTAVSPACRWKATSPDIKATSYTAQVIWMWYVNMVHMTHTDLYPLQVCRAVNCQHFIVAPVDLLVTHDNHSDLAWLYFTTVYTLSCQLADWFKLNSLLSISVCLGGSWAWERWVVAILLPWHRL